jgi:hypothetical protein
VHGRGQVRDEPDLLPRAAHEASARSCPSRSSSPNAWSTSRPMARAE